ncbi:hypothetical protein KC332_g913 [Hortaea werneckii]|nr:hypothetical protein KC350_g15470 [Hortaea werneckii]KAI6846075.1 hypothetical protein KC358_g3051 [Hortaea werneckii]KAI6944681.1 hypothetical protein KC348_g3922 [Hortaea werneckii]KAI6945415.1 hypothetical protein KC341_g146 [Hortaea werneckii]KAI6960290.1 hypothetical protein KC321_g12934 [Hortaea werneckii]
MYRVSVSRRFWRTEIPYRLNTANFAGDMLADMLAVSLMLRNSQSTLTLPGKKACNRYQNPLPRDTENERGNAISPPAAMNGNSQPKKTQWEQFRYTHLGA